MLKICAHAGINENLMSSGEKREDLGYDWVAAMNKTGFRKESGAFFRVVVIRD